MKKPNWYDDWEIITDYDRSSSNWIRKVIRIPNSATIKEKVIWTQYGSLTNELILDLESALYTLTERDKHDNPDNIS